MVPVFTSKLNFVLSNSIVFEISLCIMFAKNIELICFLTPDSFKVFKFLANFSPIFAKKSLNSSTFMFFSFCSLFLVAHVRASYRRKSSLLLLLDSNRN